MRYAGLLLLTATLTTPAYASLYSVGPLGANATVLKLPNNAPLDGEGVGIGMVETYRPGKPGFDPAADVHQAVKPHKIFNQAGPAPLGYPIDNEQQQDVLADRFHAQAVAGIMIGDGSFGDYSQGVAEDAKLYASGAFPVLDPNDFIRSLHKIATHPVSADDPDVRVMNMSSYWESEQIFLDGNFDLTQYVDWSAARHDILYVVAGISEITIFPTSPSDNFNGITVVASAIEAEAGRNVYRRAASLNNAEGDFDAFGNRVSADIMAPGQELTVTWGGDMVRPDPPGLFSGTSVAAPHVAGVAAQLHQYGQWKVANVGGPRWDFIGPSRHEVMKAVILNSADKFRGVHGSRRTAQSQGGFWTWEQSPAREWDISLDYQMGAGHLNGQNALRQYRAGEWDAGVVPNIGWNYGLIGTGDYDTYIFNRALGAGEFVSATLCWDVRVQTINPNPNNHLDGFFDYQDVSQYMNDLDLYLQPAGTDPSNTALAYDLSVSFDDNVEHIFFPVPFAGHWQIVVALFTNSTQTAAFPVW